MTPSETTTTAITRCIVELWRVLAEREETVHRLQASNTELLERARKAEASVKEWEKQAVAEKFVDRLLNLPLTNDQKMLEPVFCEHANENPARCYCPPNCYCQAHTCKDRPKEARGVRGYAGDPPQ